MKFNKVIATCLMSALFVSCDESPNTADLRTFDDRAVHEDPQRFVGMSFFTVSYLDYDVYGTFILPAERNSLAFAVHAASVAPSRTRDKWGGVEEGPTFYWDRNWGLPKRFRVWWFRVVDRDVFTQHNQYDEYTTKETQPGAAWCEAVVTIDSAPSSDARYFALHFYPDGHVEADMSAKTQMDAVQPRFTVADRDRLPVLSDRPCLKEISNPFYGLKRPIQIN